MGQTGCPETYSQEFCCGQSMSPADVQKTPSTGGRGHPPLNCRQEGGAAQGQSAGTNCRLGSYCLLSNQQASAGHLPCGQCTRNTAANTQGRVAAHPQAPLWKQGGDTMLPRSLGGGDDSRLINDQGTEVSNRLSLSPSYNL